MEAALGRLIDLIFGALDMFRFWVVLYEGQQGIVLRLGKYNRTLGPGIHWRLPMRLEELRWDNVKTRTTNTWDMSFGNNGKVITITCAAAIRVVDIKHVLIELEKWEDFAYTQIGICVADVFKANLGTLGSPRMLEDECKVTISEALHHAGIELFDFGLTNVAEARPFKLFIGAR